MSAEQQPQDPNLPLSLRLQPRQRWQILQEWVKKLIRQRWIPFDLMVGDGNEVIVVWKFDRIIVHLRCFSAEPDHELFLVYGKGRPGVIRGMDMNAKVPDEYMIPIENLMNPRALDFHATNEFIYFADATSYIIGRQKIDGTDRDVILKDGKDWKFQPTKKNLAIKIKNNEVSLFQIQFYLFFWIGQPVAFSHWLLLLISGIHTVEGIAVDWMGNNLYWTDDGPKKTISVARLEKASQTRKILIEGKMSHPRAIVVDPQHGWDLREGAVNLMNVLSISIQLRWSMSWVTCSCVGCLHGRFLFDSLVTFMCVGAGKFSRDSFL